MVILSLVLLFFSCTKVYYIDSVLGDDSNSGKSPDKAWASLEKVNQAIFNQAIKFCLNQEQLIMGN